MNNDFCVKFVSISHIFREQLCIFSNFEFQVRHYNPLTRPVRNSSTVIKIGLGLAVNQIFELDEVC